MTFLKAFGLAAVAILSMYLVMGFMFSFIQWDLIFFTEYLLQYDSSLVRVLALQQIITTVVIYLNIRN